MIALKNDQDDYNLTGGTTRVPINMKFNTLRSKLIRHILHKYANYGHFKDFKWSMQNKPVNRYQEGHCHQK